jgi:hypothetical protein
VERSFEGGLLVAATSPTASSSSSSSAVIQGRLIKIQKAVRKATEDALKQAHQTGVQPTTLTRINIQDNTASFMLGMDLFGQEVPDLERQVRKGLEELEIQLDHLLVAADHENSDDVYNDENGAVPRSRNVMGRNDDVHDRKRTFTADPISLTTQAQSLQQKIRFLKECSMARSLLDESTTLSSPALSSSSGMAPDWVEAAHRLLQAGDALESAQSILHEETALSSSSPEQQQHAAIALQVGTQIIESIRNDVRRQRVELVTKATSVFETSIMITSSSMSVKGAEELESAYLVLECLSGVSSGIVSKNRDVTKQGSSAVALEDWIRTFCQESLLKTIFDPVLEAYRDENEKNSSRPPLRQWVFSETTETPTTGALLAGVSTSASNKGPIHRLSWEIQDDKDNTSSSSDAEGGLLHNVESWKTTLDFVQRILDFVDQRILLERESPRNMVGQRLFGKPNALPSSLMLDALGLESSLLGSDDRGVLMETLFELISETCIPEYVEPTTQLGQLAPLGKKLLSYCVPFGRNLVERKLMPFDPAKPPRLVQLCQKFEQNYVDNRRCVLLNEARDLLVCNDYHNTVVVGVDVSASTTKSKASALGVDRGMEVFQLHKASISVTSSKLMLLVRNAMNEAVATQRAVSTMDQGKDSPLALLSPTLYRAAREMLSLFRAIIPASHGAEVAHVPRTAAVLHNDCVFLAHNCLTLGLEYKDQFRPPSPVNAGSEGGEESKDEQDPRGKLLQQTCMFVDMVPLFREMADRAMGDMLELQKHQIADIVGTRITYLGKALKSDESLHEWSEAETALAAGIYHLRHLSQAWKPILSQAVFVRSVGYLADAIFVLYLAQVKSATAISASACHFCSALFSKATDEIGRLLLGEDSQAYGKTPVRAMKPSTRPSVSGMVEGCSKEWQHFEAVGQFMNMNLAEIRAALANGVFRQVGSQELSRLIVATFSDSPKRQALLHTLATV